MYLCLVYRKSRTEAILGRKRLRHPMDHSDNNDCHGNQATKTVFRLLLNDVENFVGKEENY